MLNRVAKQAGAGSILCSWRRLVLDLEAAISCGPGGGGLHVRNFTRRACLSEFRKGQLRVTCGDFFNDFNVSAYVSAPAIEPLLVRLGARLQRLPD